jgi:preprotein translocase subunit SecA
MSVGTILSQQQTEAKRIAYAADITYGTNNEFGFDYLRDNMEHSAGERRQRGLFYAIVDEVDSILIDEARTPLIISGQAEDHTELYRRVNAVPALLTEMPHEPKANEPEPPGDYWVDRKAHQVYLSDAGHEKAEQVLEQLELLSGGASLYDASNIALMHHLMAALRAHTLYFRDQHYVVQNGEVIIVDEFTGRLMPGRRWSEGLHQAVEAKEGANIQAENQTLASITFQNYFRMYGKLAGMTGTADTEAYEFQEIYSLETVVVPTHRPMVRDDRQDQVFRTAREKYNAIIADMRDCHERGQPVLVGTTSIENSELLAGMLEKEKLPHQVLNAKQHAREAEIVIQAGRPGVITIATNMAGRGTDIVLGGNISREIDAVQADESLAADERAARLHKLRADWQLVHDQVIAAGGLHIVGTERHESRRIDNQLRGRSGRQGDPGSSRFYLSMEDPLLRIFAGDRLKAIMDRLKLPDGEAIEAGMVSRAIESAQRKVEARNFDIRKQLLEYDDVANDQRRIVYSDRNSLLDAAEVGERITELRHQVFTELVRVHVPAESVEEQWDVAALQKALESEWLLAVALVEQVAASEQITDDDIVKLVLDASDTQYRGKVETVGAEAFAGFERSVLLQVIDQHWREHLAMLDHLRQGIHLRGYAQKNPKQEYKREAFELFALMQNRVRNDVTRLLMTVRVETAEQAEQAGEQLAPAEPVNVSYGHPDFAQAQAAAGEEANAEALAVSLQQVPGADDEGQQPFKRYGRKIGRNDPCPCGSGRKYKACHGRLA